MPTVKLVLTATLDLPDSWAVVTHADGHTVLRDGARYIDVDLVCMTTSSANDATWTQDDEVTEEFFAALREFESVLQEI